MNDKVAIKVSPVKKERCPSKHSGAYKTSFGNVYCPDCEHNIEEVPETMGVSER